MVLWTRRVQDSEHHRWHITKHQTYQLFKPSHDVKMISARRTWRVRDSEPPADSGRGWTRVLIPPTLRGQWENRPHVQVLFCLTQLLTRHSYFNRYLYRIGRDSSHGCSRCGPPGSNSGEEDSAYHTPVDSKAFESDREALI